MLQDETIIYDKNNFNDWTSLNDTIMGGNSNAKCNIDSKGLVFSGEVVEQDGGFVSCRSPYLEPPLNLSKFKGFQFEILGEGRTLKAAIACSDKSFGITKFFLGSLRWVAAIPTSEKGITSIKIPFNSLKPAVRAKKINLPIGFNSSSVTRIQLLYSKFGLPGELNEDFKPGPINIFLRSISAYS